MGSKAVLYPIGIESSSGKQYSPIFKDKSFVYIPIPEFPPEYLADIAREYGISANGLYEWPPQYLNFSSMTRDAVRETPHDKVLGDFLLKNIWKHSVEDGGKIYSAPLPDWYPHYDPEFKTFTYGEGSDRKARTLSNLVKGDLLLFYASLSPAIQQDPAKKYVIGYFEIENVYNFKPQVGGKECRLEEVPDELKFNAHLRETLLQANIATRFMQREDLPVDQGASISVPSLNAVIAVGNPSKSKLLKNAIPLTDSSFHVYPKLAKFIPCDFHTAKIHMGTRIFDRNGQFDHW